MAGLAAAFGSGSMTNSFAELEQVECLLVIGSNTTVAHPIASMRLFKALENGARLIVIDPRKTQIADHAHLHIPLNLGSDVALINGLMHVIYKNGWHNESFIEERTENFAELVKTIEAYPPERVAKIAGVEPADLIKAAEWYATSKNSAIVYVLGITQHSTGVDNVKSLANLAMLCGHIGRPSTGVNPLRGQNNVQGACDMGVLPNVYTGYQVVTSPDVKEKFEKAWGAKLSSTPGLTLVEQMEGLLSGKIKGMVIFGANPMMSYPDVNMVRRAMRKAEFTLAIDIFPTPSTELAHVVLPGTSFAESDGTFTNSERRVQRVRPAIAPLAGKTNWAIIQELAQRLGADWSYDSAEDIFNEMAGLTPYYGGMSYQRLGSRGLCWPCPTADHPGTMFLHKDRFVRGKGLFHVIEYRPPAEAPDEQYPFWLTTGTMYSHYLTASMTSRCESLNLECDEAYVEIHPQDAADLKVGNGDPVEVSSRRGTIEPVVRITGRVRPGTLFIPLHFLKNPVNKLTNAALDPISKTPEYKVCSARIDLIGNSGMKAEEKAAATG